MDTAWAGRQAGKAAGRKTTEEEQKAKSNTASKVRQSKMSFQKTEVFTKLNAKL